MSWGCLMLQSILAQRKTVKARLFYTFLVVWPALLVPASATADPPAGQWQEKTEIVWDAGAAKFVRRSFRVFDPHPEFALEFYWLPETESGKQAGAISGAGELIWYRKGASPYDRASRHSTYRGSLKNGLPDGWGKLSLRSGLTYEGEWKEGRMEGEGSIEYETRERYQGNFVAGEPDGSGKYIAANGQVVAGSDLRSKIDVAVVPAPEAVFPSSAPVMAAGSGSISIEPRVEHYVAAKAAGPVPLALFPVGQNLPFAPATPKQPTEVAQVPGPITMTLYVDRVKNNEFKEGNPEVDSFVYGQTDDAGTIAIRLDAPAIMARWKGDAPITADSDSAFLLDPNQFAPVFLVVDVVNDTNRDAQIVGGYVDVADSATDLQPYLEISGVNYFATEDAFDPAFNFLNEGWGPVQNAKITYSFGKEPQAGSQTFVIDAGTFDQSTEVSTLPGFIASGVNVSDLKKGPVPCPSEEELPNCLAKLVQSGLFGQLGGAMFAEYTHVYTQISGVMDYSWTDSQGSLQQKQSPISVKLPVLEFVIGAGVEYGAPSAVDRKLPAIMLALDRQNYRLPFSYRGRLKAQQNLRFALTLDAEKSSHHLFKIVLQLADGSTVSTPPVDLLMFRSRAVQLY
jgi:hypothetical protein